MNYRELLGAIVLSSLALTLNAANHDDRLAQQNAMDQRCYEARQVLIEPLRQEQITQCISQQGSRKDAVQYCQQSYANFGERMGVQPALFSDIPECEAALQFQQSTRSGR